MTISPDLRFLRAFLWFMNWITNLGLCVIITWVGKKKNKGGCKVGICGQAPSDYPEFTRFLAEEGIDSISLNPHSVIEAVMKNGGV